MTRAPARVVSLAVLAAVAGCRLVPPPEPDDYRAEALPALQTPGQWTAGETSGAVTAGWPASFGDAQLASLVTEAIAHNPDLRVAAARVQVASEYAQLADSTLWPQVNLLARGESVQFFGPVVPNAQTARRLVQGALQGELGAVSDAALTGLPARVRALR